MKTAEWNRRMLVGLTLAAGLGLSLLLSSASRQSWFPPIVLGLGVVFTFLVCGILYNILGQATDVEDLVRKRTEELARSNQRLEESTREVQAANKRLQELAALKDEFVAKVSHELRTPLTSIKEGLNLMLDKALGEITPDQRDFLKTMDGDLDRLTELINTMLDISKIESGRMRLVRRRTAITELIRSTLRSYQIVAAGCPIVERFQPVPDVFIDTNRTLQVLGNLFSNAVKYSRPGSPITFGVEQRDGSVLLWVEDQGEGIAPEEIPKLFQKFSQVGRQDPNRPRGTGLGLVICKELVELHGGRIEAESKVGVGSRFTLCFPAYSDGFALQESFREIQQHEAAADGQGVGLIAIRVSGEADGGGISRQELGKVAEEVRRRLHHEDIVAEMEPCWVVALAATGIQGVQAIVRRLRQSLPGVERCRFGSSLHPVDGQDAAALLEHARRNLGRELAPQVEGEAGP